MEKMDRRVKYTKNMLKDALVQLLQKQHISSISVKALCELADINRSTFYSHYADPHDLLHQLEKEVVANVRQYLDQQDYQNTRPISQQVMTNILEYAKQNAGLFEALLSENSDYAVQEDIIGLSQIVSSQYNLELDATTKAYIQCFGTAGCISVIQKWLRDGTVESASSISDFIIQITQNGIASFESLEMTE
ncbi:hypothetical protein SDC9_195658 [bioreactor metagenome]|uniref:HTH tetR-type domain-containing protein n=1 Tax=bioreactor metagenome TaxID=1076179 RepID=A0A645IIB6_9ZZZZ|nr:TetR/AcrR family transcriptional regulator C-terminal domain-containing protein [Candidatus Pelethousia sp.]NCB30407.1 TetR/AcrR family transcriptional regulator [Clostridia bacterium]